MFLKNLPKFYLFEALMSMHFIGGVLVVFYTDWGGITFTDIMVLQSAFVFFAFLLEVPTGALADLMGRKWSLAAGALCNSVAALIYTIHPSFWIFLLGEFFWAMAMALVSGADEALVYDSLKAEGKTQESARVLSRGETFNKAALLISAPLGSIIAAKWGLRMTMVLISIPTFLAFLTALTFHEPPYRNHADHPKTFSEYLRTMRRGVLAVWQTKVVRALAFDRIMVHTFCFYIIWLYQLVLQRLDAPVPYFGTVQALLLGAQILFLANLRRIETWLPSRRSFLTVTTLIPALSFFVLGGMFHAHIAWAFTLPFIAMIAAFGMGRRSYLQAKINVHFSSTERATMISALAMAGNLVRALTNPLVGWGADHSLATTLIILGATLCGILLLSRKWLSEDSLQ